MKFVLFVEGETEQEILPKLMENWLNKRLSGKIKIKKPVNFKGWSQLVKETPKRFEKYINAPDSQEIIAIIALFDFKDPDFYPKNKNTVEEKYKWAKEHLENKVKHDKFRQFFAVHEAEAWLLSNPNIFPGCIPEKLPKTIKSPEKVNFNNPPSKLLNDLYNKELNRDYKKITDGKNLFKKLDPEITYNTCPYFKELMDEMLQLASGRGEMFWSLDMKSLLRLAQYTAILCRPEQSVRQLKMAVKRIQQQIYNRPVEQASLPAA